jgi:hypothetical protein
MAEEISKGQEQDNASASADKTQGGVSKLAMVIAFVGAAFAAWIIISMNLAG